MVSGEYNVKFAPRDNKTWRETQELEVSISLVIENETHVFKGLASLHGIIKSGAVVK